MSKLNGEIKEKILGHIRQMSYYNAAEGGQWSREGTKRSTFRESATKDFSDWIVSGIPVDDLKKFVQDNRGLCSFSDFITDRQIDRLLK